MTDKKYDIRYVANYLRKSRVESDQDLAKHKLILDELCAKNKFKSVEYPEVGTSDSIDMRPKFSKLLKEVEQGIYDAVCVVDFDRLGRGDQGEQDRIKKAFKKSGTLIITPDKIFDLNNDSDDTFIDFKGFLARQEYKMIAKRLRQGKIIGALQGYWTNGTPPFPYEYQQKKDKNGNKGLIINQEKYKIYREMIESAMDNETAEDIAISLNKRGILTSKGNAWSNIAIQRLLVDMTHLGKIVRNKTEGDAHLRKKSNAKDYKVLPMDEWVVVDGRHEAVKTQEEHDLILSLISKRQKVPKGNAPKKHSLTGLIKCGKCGYTHTFYYIKDELNIKPCWHKNKYGEKCGNVGILAKPVEDAIIQSIQKYKEKCLKAVDFEDSSSKNSLLKKISDNELAVKKFEKSIDKINDAYELGDYTRDEWISRKEKWNRQIQEVRAEIAELKAQLDASQTMSREERLSNLSNVLDNIYSVTDVSVRNELYKSIINSVEYLNNGEKVSIQINFK